MRPNFEIIPDGEGKKIFINFDTAYRSPAYLEIGRNLGQYMKTFDGEKYGFMTFHRDVCPPRFTDLPNISELFFYGFARVQIGKFWGLVSDDGREILKAKYDYIYIFSEDLLDSTIVILKRNNLYGLYIPAKHFITEVKYSNFILKKGYIKTLSACCQGILLYNGTQIFNTEYKQVENFHGMYMATKNSGKKVLKSTKWLKESAEADEFYQPVSGVLKARLSNKFALINADTGENITQFRYCELTNYDSNGYAYARDEIGGVVKKIDRNGMEHPNKPRRNVSKD